MFIEAQTHCTGSPVFLPVQAPYLKSFKGKIFKRTDKGSGNSLILGTGRN